MFLPAPYEALPANRKAPFVLRGRIYERTPAHRPYPGLPEAYQPDTIALLQRRAQRRMQLMGLA